MNSNQAPLAPYWNIVSVVLPLAGAFLAAVVLKSSSPGGFGDAIGGVLKAVIALGTVCLLGEAAAITALVRGERMAGLSILGAILNIVVIVPAIYLASRIE